MVVTAAFLAIVAFVIAAGVRAASRGLPPRTRPRWRTAGLAAAWLALTGALPLSGLLRPGGPVPAPLFMAVILAMSVAVAAGAPGRRMAAQTPLWALVGFQAFRLPLELVLHEWVAAGIAPPQMTWTGQNLDIVAGALALVSIPAVRRRPVLAWVPTVVGLALLLNVIRVVALSLPGPLQAFEAPVLLPFRFPHVWIGTVCVAGALTGHLVALRALIGRPHEGTPRTRVDEPDGPAAGA